MADPGLISNPILNGPYDIPAQHFVLGPTGPTGEIREGRRASESFIAIASVKKGAKGHDGSEQTALDLDTTGERLTRNTLINDIRKDVGRWRQRGFERVTPTTRKLLQYWADPDRENRVLFCQREAAETAIFLAEVAGKAGYADWNRQLDEVNTRDNLGLPRVALKMATGAGKTVVMAMLIAWQTANKVASPRDIRFAKRFLIVAPGITIRDRLRVLQPGHTGNYYDERDLVPADLKAAVGRAQIVVTNYHAFIARDAHEVKGVSATTKKLLRPDEKDPFKESPDAVAARVLRDFGTNREPLVVINDEAHHCYRDRPLEAVVKDATLTKEDLESARVWFSGLLAVQKRVGIKAVFDLSATPFYLSGSGYQEGLLFPWVVSDFSLMDAIESGIVKIPRTPVDDDATGDLVTYLHLWDVVGKQLPKKRKATTDWVLPAELEGALESLYRSYEKSFTHWKNELASLGEPPPVYIVVCPNTAVSRRVYDWIAGTDELPGELALFSNTEDGATTARPRTLLVDSVQLESGDALKPDFRKDAAAEIDAFKSEYRRRHPGADVDAITDEDLLREVLNTVGKKGLLGEGVRCVVSVAMLTEGWDANTVTHILGIRAFGSQLLCEQVVGRGLRRRSYALNADGRFEPEYANVYGVPFAFIPTDRPTKEPAPSRPAQLVQSVPGREHLRIEFPMLAGYRLEIPDAPLHFDPAGVTRFRIGPDTVPNYTELAGVVGAAELEQVDWAAIRPQQVVYALARRLLAADQFAALGGDERPWRFAELVVIARRWLEEFVDLAPGFGFGHLLKAAQIEAVACEAILQAVSSQEENRRARLRPMLRADAVGSTAGVGFATRKAAIVTEKSEISHVVLDGSGGNTWEQLLAGACELDRNVAAYAKNDHLGFEIPYVHKGISHAYLPDFLVRLVRRDGDDVTRTLIVEVSGGQKEPGLTAAKAATARNQWCPAVNNHRTFGRWGYIEIKDVVDVREQLAAAIDALYNDHETAIAGDPDLLDFDEFRRAAS